MTRKQINYREFIKYIYDNFNEEITLEEVEDILHLEEDYNKDSPVSLGKSLILKRLIFSGKKLSGKEFFYDKELYTGINAWIADNLKGKSTIFKIIKYALTGVESIKPDIKRWIDEIILEFKIGKAVYTIYIDKSGRDKGGLYTFGIERFLKLREAQKLEIIEKDKEFEFRSKNQLEEKMQEFFFDHFSFYTLKYTQKSSSKEEMELNTSNLSWSTYFKSIYLESSNYEYLFFDNEKYGAQGRKIFEMILGLPLTYPINMLGVRKDKVSEAIGKLKLTDKSRTESQKNRKEKLEKEYNQVRKSLRDLREASKFKFDENPLIDEYSKLQEKLNTNRKNLRLAKDAYETEKDKLNQIDEETQNLEHDRTKIKEEVNRLLKQELHLELYKEAGSFFTNLEIKVCPHCETNVSEDKKALEQETHICSLCGENSTEQKIEVAELQAKLSHIEKEKNSLNEKHQTFDILINKQKENLVKIKKSVERFYSKVVSIPSMDQERQRLKEIEKRINEISKERGKQNELREKKEELIRKEAVLKFQIKEIEKQKATDNFDEITKLNLERKILEYALEALEKKRIKLNKDILNKLEELILKEIHAFGLSSIEKIEISNKYDLIFTQNQVTEKFSDLTEGEKLRVKLAFYLSIIQLDIEHNLGRHPRFLIFDSPGSEEMIEEHLHGLSDILKNVNERFNKRLQIFVGSALREFSQITDPEKTVIKQKKEFIF